MPVLRPFLLPTASGSPDPVEAPSRNRMDDKEFYSWRQRREAQKIKPTIRPSEKVQEGFIQEPVTQQYLEAQLQKMQSRTPPPTLEPMARVRAPEMPSADSFKSYYERLNTIKQIGNEQVARESALASHRRLAALQSLQNVGPSGGGGQPSPGGAGQAKFVGGGNVRSWIDQAAQILGQSGIGLSEQDKAWVSIIIQHESGGNPNAINLWDSNAAKGIPSKGLMQTIDPTFNSHKLPGYNDIYNPIHNIIAGVRYAIRRYGSIGNVPGIKNLRNGGRYVGY